VRALALLANVSDSLIGKVQASALHADMALHAGLEGSETNVLAGDILTILPALDIKVHFVSLDIQGGLSRHLA
jgi:hypothetical protein